MNLNEIIELDKKYYMNTFGDRLPVNFTHGSGCTLYDEDGKAYTDFLAGIATNALGYNCEGFVESVSAQLCRVTHLSNYFYSEPQALLAKALCENSCADRVFFASTGAEANEGAIKLARKYFKARGENRYDIISAWNSFHGRTLATLAATGQPKYREDYTPLPNGFINVTYCDIEAVREALTPHTAAVLVEPIQGEGGVIEAGIEYLQALRQLCDEEGLLLIFDEVQTGMGRTGRLFAHQLYGVEPDIFTIAKALGNGLPISALLCKESVATFKPGDHGTTFGGNPLCCTAGLYVVETLLSAGFLDDVVKKSSHLRANLNTLKSQFPSLICDVRGQGLLIGVELAPQLSAMQAKLDLLERGFVIGTAGTNVIRLVPPLIIDYSEIDALTLELESWLKSQEA